MAHPQIRPCLWFDTQAEEAAEFYVSVFPDSRIVSVSHYGEAGREAHGQTPGTVMTVEFELSGKPFMALNGGPHFQFDEAVSFEVECETQKEIDYYWERLTEGGGEPSQCGWLEDRFGLSWQIVPRSLKHMMAHQESEKGQRTMNAMLTMTKLDLARLEAAYDGRAVE